MNIFFTASVRGGRAHQPNHAAIVKALGAYGTVSSEHIADKDLSQWGEAALDSGEIRERELAALKMADTVVAEVTAPSLGVGYLIREATSAGKKVVALYCGEDTEKLSALVKGDAGVQVIVYKDEADVVRALESAFA